MISVGRRHRTGRRETSPDPARLCRPFFFVPSSSCAATRYFLASSQLYYQLRRVKYLNHVIEQDHRFVKKKVRVAQCFKRFHTAERTLEGIEAVNMMRKGQVKRLAGSDAQGQAKFVLNLFRIAA